MNIAVWLVSLFTPTADEEAIVGDLLEEFSHVASERGALQARWWLWRQTLRTIGELAVGGFRSAPWTISAVVCGAFLLRWLVSRLTNGPISGGISSALDKCGLNDPEAYVFWLTTSMLVVRLFVNLATGVLVAVIAKGREMTATIGLGLLGIALAIQAHLMTVAKTGDTGVWFTLPHTVAFSFAIVAAGAAVRTYRSGASTRRAIT